MIQDSIDTADVTPVDIPGPRSRAIDVPAWVRFARQLRRQGGRDHTDSDWLRHAVFCKLIEDGYGERTEKGFSPWWICQEGTKTQVNVNNWTPDLIGIGGRGHVEVKVSLLADPPRQDIDLTVHNIVIIHPFNFKTRIIGPDKALLEPIVAASVDAFLDVYAIVCENTVESGPIHRDDPRYREIREGRIFSGDVPRGDVPPWLEIKMLRAKEPQYKLFVPKSMVTARKLQLNLEHVTEPCWGFVCGLQRTGDATIDGGTLTRLGFSKEQSGWIWPTELLPWDRKRPATPTLRPQGPEIDVYRATQVYSWFQRGQRAWGRAIQVMEGLYVLVCSPTGGKLHRRTTRWMFLIGNGNTCPFAKDIDGVYWCVHRMDVGCGRELSLRQANILGIMESLKQEPAHIKALYFEDAPGKMVTTTERSLTTFSFNIAMAYTFHNCGALSEARVIMHTLGALMDGGACYEEAFKEYEEMYATVKCKATKTAMLAFALEFNQAMIRKMRV